MTKGKNVVTNDKEGVVRISEQSFTFAKKIQNTLKGVKI